MTYLVYVVFVVSCFMTLVNGLKIIRNYHMYFKSSFTHIFISGFIMITSAIYLWLVG